MSPPSWIVLSAFVTLVFHGLYSMNMSMKVGSFHIKNSFKGMTNRVMRLGNTTSNRYVSMSVLMKDYLVSFLRLLNMVMSCLRKLKEISTGH